jgi:hypothetical protein
MAAKTATESKPKARSDAYTGMLLLSLVVLIAGCVLLYLDFSQYPSARPAAPQKVPAISNPLEGAGQPGAGAPQGGGGAKK